ncbi:hypothetical protein VCHA35O141_50164 [Vibrio chagasii]|nr:hypothetical protein VCHA35O137_140086 [Vibrio chagasii]CAK2026169.1 hypothetical protein VCRA2110O182_30004 [Vibrio crassostreae]CAH6997843.1 hypothetical protein VCHA56P515_160087 [Vibrio chagasii]CAH7034837.1 hypothetical protein VCHA35O141_50164 [Vibrio chagasii]CAH7044554.1 hypothetical protein VCHA40O237_10347 [Vibrio chagasii]
MVWDNPIVELVDLDDVRYVERFSVANKVGLFFVLVWSANVTVVLEIEDKGTA